MIFRIHPKLLHAFSYFVATDELRPVLNCLCIQPNNTINPEWWQLSATNGHILFTSKQLPKDNELFEVESLDALIQKQYCIPLTKKLLQLTRASKKGTKWLAKCECKNNDNGDQITTVSYFESSIEVSMNGKFPMINSVCPNGEVGSRTEFCLDTEYLHQFTKARELLEIACPVMVFHSENSAISVVFPHYEEYYGIIMPKRYKDTDEKDWLGRKHPVPEWIRPELYKEETVENTEN